MDFKRDIWVYLTVFTVVTFSLSNSLNIDTVNKAENSQDLNLRPIIGILTQPWQHGKPDESYIAASYVKVFVIFLEINYF